MLTSKYFLFWKEPHPPIQRMLMLTLLLLPLSPLLHAPSVSLPLFLLHCSPRVAQPRCICCPGLY